VQSRHTPPLLPQVVIPVVWQTPLKQHPLGQFVALQPEHVPLAHC
jgi:hypothetical protein